MGRTAWTRALGAFLAGFLLATPAAAQDAAALRAELKTTREAARDAPSGSAEKVRLYSHAFELQTQLGDPAPDLIQALQMIAGSIDYDDPQVYPKKIPIFTQMLRIQEAGGPAFAAAADETRSRLVEFYDLTSQPQSSIPLLRARIAYRKATNGDITPLALDLSKHLREAGDIPGAVAAISFLPADCLYAWAPACFAASTSMMQLASSIDDVATVDRLGLGVVALLRAGDCRKAVIEEVSSYYEYKKNDAAGHALAVNLFKSRACTSDQRLEIADWLEVAYDDYALTEPLRREALAKARSTADRADASNALGSNLLQQKRTADAIPFLKAAVDLLIADSSPDGFSIIFAGSTLAEAYEAAGDHARALSFLSSTLAVPAVAKEMRESPLNQYLLLAKARTLMALQRAAEARTLLAEQVRILGAQPWTYELLAGFTFAEEALEEAGGAAEGRAAIMDFARRLGGDPNVPMLRRLEIRLRGAEAAGREPSGHLAALTEARAVLSDIAAFTSTLSPVSGQQGESVRQALSNDVLLSDYGRGAALSLQVDLGWSERGGASGSTITAEGFVAAQGMEGSAAARALAQTAARVAAGSGPLGELARQQQELSRALQTASASLTTAVADTGAEEVRRRQAEVDRLGGELSAVDIKLHKDFPRYAELVAPAALSLAEVQTRLRPGEGLILIVPVWDHVHVFAVSKTRLAWHRVEGGTESVAMRVAVLRCQVDPATCGEAGRAASRGDPQGKPAAGPDDAIPPFDLAVAHSLYRDLIAPVESALDGVTQLFVTASGPLSGLPLGLLVTKPPAATTDTGSSAALGAAPWLADRYALTTLPSVSSLRAFNLLREAPAERRAFVGYGDPVLEGRGLSVAQEDVHRGAPGGGALANPEALRKGLAPLPHTRDELKAMADALGAPASSLRLGAAATETAVKTETDIGAARVVAFATHGLIPTRLNALEEPGLVFTPPAEATANDDGYLTASEAAGLKLSADWLILSACNTAAADGKPGAESLSGLARAFLYAGAKALLASHWSVLDDATEALTVETLGARRADPGLSKAQALQRAMVAVRSGHRLDGTAIAGWTPVWTHPAAWAPFVLIGAGE